MSTRCHIAFYEKEAETEADLEKFFVLLYRHCDGYPEGVLPDIIPILRELNKLDDVEYCSAYVVAKLFDNIGISKSFHRDVNYLYAIYPSGRIDIYRTNFWDKFEVKKIKTIDITSPEDDLLSLLSPL
jgi:hypothetical protein